MHVDALAVALDKIPPILRDGVTDLALACRLVLPDDVIAYLLIKRRYTRGIGNCLAYRIGVIGILRVVRIAIALANATVALGILINKCAVHKLLLSPDDAPLVAAVIVA